MRLLRRLICPVLLACLLLPSCAPALPGTLPGTQPATSSSSVASSSAAPTTTIAATTAAATTSSTAVTSTAAASSSVPASSTVPVSSTQHKHSYQLSSSEDSTCSVAGRKVYTCPCGDSYTEKALLAPHTWGDWTVIQEATEEANGKKQRTCSVCQQTQDGIVYRTEESWKEYTPAQPGEKVIAITFDDGPHNKNTNAILDVLEKYKVKATFFMVGHRLKGMSKSVVTGILNRVLDAGCQIGNHSHSHADFNTLSVDGMLEEFNKTQQAVYDLVGVYPSVIRPPYGSLSKDRAKLLDAFCIWWSVDPKDWQDRNSETVKSRVLNGRRSGDIVLLHDIHATTAAAVEDIVVGLLDQGFRLVTVEELFDLRSKEPDGTRYYSQSTIR